MNTGSNELLENLKKYKRKFYINKLVKGAILTLAAILGLFLFYNTLEFAGNFITPVRAFLFFSFLAFVLVFLYVWIINPVLKLIFINQQISDEEAARQIGKYFPDVNDRLLNTLQLHGRQDVNNHLLQASIVQRTAQLSVIPFVDAVRIKENKRHLKWMLLPSMLCLGILLLAPQFFTVSTTRIINFNKEYIPEAPFLFNLQNQELTAYKNEDFALDLSLEGDNVPDQVYINTKGRRIKMAKDKDGNYGYILQKLQDNQDFYFEAAGFSSESYELNVRSRPVLKNFLVKLNFPSYINKKNEELINVGNLIVPEGTRVHWQLNASETSEVSIAFEGEENQVLKKTNAGSYAFEKTIVRSSIYNLFLSNEFTHNKDDIAYSIAIIPDQYPEINLEQYQDTSLFKFMVLGGNVADDYGLTRLQLHYTVKPANGKGWDVHKTKRLYLDPQQSRQSYYYQWRIDSLGLKEGEKIEYYLQVWDNDGINGAKASKTATFTFAVPSRSEAAKIIEKDSEQTENQADRTKGKAEELQKDLSELNNKLKGKKNLDWNDEKEIEKLLEKRDKLNEEIEKLQEQNRALDQKRERFGEQKESIKEKSEQLQKLMDELLDEETKKLYEELKKLLEEKKGISEIQKNLQELNKREKNLEKELERALELFKRMKFEMKLDEVVQELNEDSQMQEKLSEEEDNPATDKNELLEQQKELSKSFEETVEKIKEMKDLNQDLTNPESMPDTSEEEKDIKEDQQASEKLLEDNKPKAAKKKQKSASGKMKEMAEKMAQMQAGMEMEMMEENLDNLRDIMSNLITLSFDQENLMKDFRNVNQSDPRFVDLSQQQLKLKDDAKVIEDSLFSLAKRVFQIEAFVNREVGDMNQKMDEAVEAIKERNQAVAIGKQQFAMTSMNNLALLLDDVLQQMQQQMADAMGKPGKGKGKKKGPSLGDLQQQLNQKIEQLKKSGKGGRELSEELAQMAAEQEMIRNAMKEMSEKLENGNGGKKDGTSKEIMQKMEETETDLVNKQITQETIERQKEILTRLLQSEDAMREREMDEEREAEKAKVYRNEVPKIFEEYIKLKEKEIEMLRTIPLKLKPYYKQEVTEYFKRLEK